jgi:Tol biopolymer transport system component/uncharacterized protein YjdB
MTTFRSALLAVALLYGGTAVGVPGTAQAQQRRCRVAEVQIAPPEATIQIGGTQTFLAYAYDAAGSPCENVTFAWVSTNTGVATVDANGIATGIGAGVAIIAARVGTGTAARTSNRATLTVGSGSGPGGRPLTGTSVDYQPEGTGRPTSLIVEPLRKSLVVGEAWRPTYRAVKADGSNADRIPLAFSVEAGGESTVSVDSTGLIRAAGLGTANIRIQALRHPGLPMRIVAIEVRQDTVSFRQRTLSLAPGETDTIPLWVRSENRPFSNLGGAFQFTSSDPTKVRVNPDNPVIEALAPGTARIVAQSAQYPTDLVTVVNVHRPVRRLTLSAPDTILVPLGVGRVVTGQAIGVDGQPVAEAPLAWAISDSSVAFYDQGSGQLRPRRIGVALLTVRAPVGRDSSVSREVTVRVIAGGLRAARTRIGLGVGERARLAVALLDDRRQTAGSAMTLLRWTSSADSVAGVEDSQVVARRPGLARLTARAPWDSTVTVDVAVGGDVLVAALREGRRDLYMLWNGGAAAMALTRDSLVEGQPAWSPDFSRIAYVVLAGLGGTKSALYAASVDGTRARRLTDDSSLAQWPSWVGPEGNRIVFEWNRGGRAQIWQYEFTGDTSGTLRQLTNAAAPSSAPSVSADGRRIVFLSLRETSPGARPAYGIYQINADGSDERLLLTGGRLDQPAFTPDGGAILFLRDDGTSRAPSRRVYRLRLGQSADSAVALTPAELYVQTYSMSHDGTKLAIGVLEPRQGNAQVRRAFMLDLGTHTQTPLTPVPGEDLSSPAMRPASAPAQHP